MDKKSFKIGDKVKVICIKSPDWSTGEKLIGAVGTLCDLQDSINPIIVEFDTEMIIKFLGNGDNYNKYNFKKCEIEHVVRVGEQLMFSFMEGD